MFSRLPPQIFRHIIKSAIPPAFHSETCRGRQKTLVSLCLVSSRFRDIAQPLLFEILWARSPRTLSKALDIIESKQWTSYVQYAIIEDTAQYVVKQGLLRRFVRNCPCVRTLVLALRYGSPLRCTVLQDLSNLTVLRLGGNRYDFSTPMVLAKLDELSFNPDPLKCLVPFLDPKILPRVRKLGMPSVKDQEDADYLTSSPIFNLIPQIDSILVDWNIINVLPKCLAIALDRTLFEFDIATSDYHVKWQSSVQHLRILGLSQTMSSENIKVLQSFGRSLDYPVELRSIYLDHKWNIPPSSRSATAVEELKKICGRKGIEIVYETQEVFRLNAWIGEEFSRRQNKIRMATREAEE